MDNLLVTVVTCLRTNPPPAPRVWWVVWRRNEWWERTPMASGWGVAVGPYASRDDAHFASDQLEGDCTPLAPPSPLPLLPPIAARAVRGAVDGYTIYLWEFCPSWALRIDAAAAP